MNKPTTEIVVAALWDMMIDRGLLNDVGEDLYDEIKENIKEILTYA